MTEPKNPESTELVNSLEISQDIIDFVVALDQEVQETRTDRAEWETRQDIYMKKRYGIRNPKTFPWVGSANFILPQIDSDINRLKPAYVNLGYGVTPIVTFEPYGPEDVAPAKKRELLFDWRMKNQVPFFKEYCLGIDYMLQRGFTIYKITWKFETRTYTEYLDLAEVDSKILEVMYMPEVDDEILSNLIYEEAKCDLSFQENVDELKRVVKEFRDGKTKFSMEFVEKDEDRADIRACDPRDDIVFPIGTTDLQQAPFIGYRFWVSKNQLKKDIASGKYEPFDDDDIDSWTGDYQVTTSDNIRAVRDGVNLHKKSKDMILLHEVCGWYDVNDDGILEKIITTYPDSDPSQVLRFIELPYEHGLFPYEVVRREFNDDEILSSRGIPALDDDFQTGISTLFNQDIDAGTISTTPTVVARKNSVKNLRNLRYIPGQVVETENGSQDYQIVQNQNLGQANRFNNMTYLKSWANDRIGSVTAAFSQINNPQGNARGGQKSATEASEIAQASGLLQSMDLLVFQMQMAGVYYQIDALYEQFGSDSEMVITNEQPVEVTRQEIQGKFNIVPNGRLDNSNPVIRANKALSMLQLFKGDPDINQSELKKMYLEELDSKLSRRLILSPQEKQQQDMMMQQAEVQGIQKQLQVKRAVDNLDVEKALAISTFEGKKYAAG